MSNDEIEELKAERDRYIHAIDTALLQMDEYWQKARDTEVDVIERCIGFLEFQKRLAEQP